jgi:predicted DNA-binding protein YlxM (UPF0122 family)
MVQVKANRVKPPYDSHTHHMLSSVEKEKLVMDVYYNQDTNVREIAKRQERHFAISVPF